MNYLQWVSQKIGYSKEAVEWKFKDVIWIRLHACWDRMIIAPLIVELTRIAISRYTYTRIDAQHRYTYQFRILVFINTSFADWVLKLTWTIFILKARLFTVWSSFPTESQYCIVRYLVIINSLHMFNGRTFWNKNPKSHFFLHLIWFLLFLKFTRFMPHTQRHRHTIDINDSWKFFYLPIEKQKMFVCHVGTLVHVLSK